MNYWRARLILAGGCPLLLAMRQTRTFTLLGWACWLLALAAGSLLSWIAARELVRLMG